MLTQIRSMLNFLILSKAFMNNKSEQEHDDDDIDSAFDKAIEEKAAEFEVTVEYYMAEFM